MLLRPILLCARSWMHMTNFPTISLCPNTTTLPTTSRSPILKYQCQWPIPTRNRTLFLITLFCHVTLTLHLLPNPILKDRCQCQIQTRNRTPTSFCHVILPSRQWLRGV